jgi:uncharacterized RDD family membrane protein YckC
LAGWNRVKQGAKVDGMSDPSLDSLALAVQRTRTKPVPRSRYFATNRLFCGLLDLACICVALPLTLAVLCFWLLPLLGVQSFDRGDAYFRLQLGLILLLFFDECRTGRSIAKRIMGFRVLSTNAMPPAWWSWPVRALCRWGPMLVMVASNLSLAPAALHGPISVAAAMWFWACGLALIFVKHTGGRTFYERLSGTAVFDKSIVGPLPEDGVGFAIHTNEISEAQLAREDQPDFVDPPAARDNS